MSSEGITSRQLEPYMKARRHFVEAMPLKPRIRAVDQAQQPPTIAHEFEYSAQYVQLPAEYWR